MKKLLLGLIILLFSLSCSEKENIINNGEDSTVILVSLKNSPSVQIVKLPEASIINQNILQNSNIVLLNPITNIKKFGDYLYLSAQKDFKLIIINKDNYELVAVVDFANDNAEVGEFVFPNSTDCYVVHPNKNYISVVDITVFKAVKKIEVGNNPNSIAVSGNQIIVTNQADNTISIVDSRTRKEEAKSIVSPLPSYALITNHNSIATIISIGNGKTNIETKSNATVTFYDYIQRKEINNIAIEEGLIKAIDNFPIGAATTLNNQLFVACQSTLFRFDIKEMNSAKFVNKQNYTSIVNDEINARLILTTEESNKNQIIIANNKSGAIQKIITFPSKIQCVLPWQ